MIRKAQKTDIELILVMAKACAKAMIANGIYQWNKHYPAKTAFINDVLRNDLYVIEIDGEVKGSIVISTLMDEEYIPIKWLTKNLNNIYIHRLAIHPQLQGKGYAQKLMDFAENYASKNKYSSIRLDTFSQNKRNQLFYEKRNYTKLENIYITNQSEHPFYCYEKVLNV